MLLDLGAVDDLILQEKLGDCVALVALELQNLAHVVVINDGAVTAFLLLECLQDLLQVKGLIEPRSRDPSRDRRLSD